MKWILVALGASSAVALGAGAIGPRPTPITGWMAVGQVRAVSVAPSEAVVRDLPTGTHLGGLETVQPAPKAAPAAPSPVQVPPNPASGTVKPGCGGASRAGKPAPLCPPG